MARKPTEIQTSQSSRIQTSKTQNLKQRLRGGERDKNKMFFLPIKCENSLTLTQLVHIFNSVRFDSLESKKQNIYASGIYHQSVHNNEYYSVVQVKNIKK